MMQEKFARDKKNLTVESAIKRVRLQHRTAGRRAPTGALQLMFMRKLSVLLALLAILPADARQPVRARKAMVVAQEPHATDVGVAVLKAGGNAVDAGVAVGLALAVTHPFAGNVGGGGFMLIRFADGRTTFLDFRERAPMAATRNMYLGPDGKPTRDSIEGWRAAGVPGTVRGLELAHQKYGKKKWTELVEPAVRLARDGFPVSYSLSQGLRSSAILSRFAESKRIFQRDGQYYEMGEVFRQPELAQTLERIGRGGAREFYEGEIARKFAAESAKAGGLITAEDLRKYEAVERKPLEGTYKGYGVITAPPPSSGGVGILQMMSMLEKSNYERTGAGSAAAIHYAAETMRRYYADRSEYMGDPDFYKVPVRKLLDPEYIRARAASIDRERVTNSDAIRAGENLAESGETTHYAIVDEQGNAVAVTYTLNGGYGNGVTVPGLGFLLNNEMDDFAAKPGEPNMFGLVQGEANAIQPGKRPLSSMTPTIVTKDGKLYLVAGAPGGSRIITAVMQVILNILDFNMNPQDAVDAPRFHHQWKPDKLYLEGGISPDTVQILERMGHQVDYSPGVVIARVEAILLRDGWLMGGSDGRGDGKASGY
jgi:gamma-glutamyltranspeptidase / glutathione hydrolase